MARMKGRLMEYSGSIYVNMMKWSEFLGKTGIIAYFGECTVSVSSEEENIENPHAKKDIFMLRNTSLKILQNIQLLTGCQGPII